MRSLNFLFFSGCCVGLFAPAQATPPLDYYQGADNLASNALRATLFAIISPHNRLDYYDDLPDLWVRTEADPSQSGRYILIYSGASVRIGSGTWNREHSWPQSYGADSHDAFSDAHHIFPADANVNSTRSNFIFDWVPNGTPVPEAPGSFYDDLFDLFEPRDADKGRIARAQLYMDLRYDRSSPEGDLVLSDFPSSTRQRMGMLSTLLRWNRMFPPDQREIDRNETIHRGFISGNRLLFQGNRNPFIDFPDFADALHTTNRYLSWFSWRMQRFSLAQIADPALAAPLANPDGDAFPNLLELSFNSDPLTADSPTRAPVALDPNAPRTFAFSRLLRPEESLLTYALEVSTDPLDPAAWQAVDLDAFIASTTPNGQVEQVVVSDASRSAIAQPMHFRLRVTQSLGDGTAFSTILDPALLPPTNLQSPFRYADRLPDPNAPDGLSFWLRSHWFGFLNDADFPWLFHANHQWLFLDPPTSHDAPLRFYDPNLGWLLTSQFTYPDVFHFNSGTWLRFVVSTAAPLRWFFSYDLNDYIREDALSQLIINLNSNHNE